jgi:hypothetical protein
MGPFITISEVRTVAAEVGDMDWSHAFYAGSMLLALIGDILIPVMFFRFERHETARREMHSENSRRLEHLDDCIDSMRTKVLEEMVSRSDLMILKEDIDNSMQSMRLTISNETVGLSQRIYRLEDTQMRKP